MSRISADEWEYTDMEWYGVDRKGNIAVFCSAGEANLPEFVCENAERADKLIEYFHKMDKTTSCILLFPKTETEGAKRTAKDFSEKGLYYFDANDGTQSGICTFQKYYTKHSYPQTAIKYELLPKHIREMLKHNFMEIEDFALVNTVHVTHTCD